MIRRFDKKQIKFSLGTTQGIIVDGQVLSGNLDDKTYNVNNLERAKIIKEKFNSEGNDFFYIADSAAFGMFIEYEMDLYINDKRVKTITFSQTDDWDNAVGKTVNCNIAAGDSVRLEIIKGETGINID